MKKIIILLLAFSGVIFAQDSTFTQADSIIVADFKKRVEAIDEYQKQLQKEFENVDVIKTYLKNNIEIIEKKKGKKSGK